MTVSVKATPLVPDRKIKSPEFLCDDRPLCQSNETTVILILGFKLFLRRLKINFDRWSLARDQNRTRLFIFFKQAVQGKDSFYYKNFDMARKIYFHFIVDRSFKQFEVNMSAGG